MSSPKHYFLNSQLQKNVERAMPWLESWQKFREIVEADLLNFENMLTDLQIPICAWIAVGDHGFLGWASLHKKLGMQLLYKQSESKTPIAIQSSSLETKVLVFPYLSELSYLLCTKIKLANTSHVGMEHFSQTQLGTPEENRADIETVNVRGKISVTPSRDVSPPMPTKVAKYV